MEERFLAEPLRAPTVTCIPRLRGGGGGARRPRRAAAPASSAGAAPVSVLDRVRDVVLRLAMLSAATTKGALPQQQTGAGGEKARGSSNKLAVTFACISFMCHVKSTITVSCTYIVKNQ
uniref:Uncharacterized protein n=1 Tax=Oryza brachyantha TaxID=4533 RepID=J3LV90_ORYBR